MNDMGVKSGLSGRGDQWEEGGQKERVVGGEYDQSTLYAYVKIE
jgi:hypothetical protein